MMNINFIDIEVLQDGNKFPDPDKADRPIISITIYDLFRKEYYTLVYRNDLSKKIKKYGKGHKIITFGNEKDMLKFTISLLKKLEPDIITAWNLWFDIRFLVNRSKKLGLDFSEISPILRLEMDYEKEVCEIGGIHTIDMLKAYKKIKKQPSYSLKYIAEVEGLTHKTEEIKDIPWLYENDLDRLIKYNKTDVQILVELENKIQILKQFIDMTKYVGANYISTPFNFSTLLDILCLRIGKDKNKILPSKPKIKKPNYEGGIVFEPKGGLHKNVIVVDMNRYYPNIILTLNESIDDEKLKLASEMVKYLFKQRDKYEKEMEKYEPGSKEYKDLARKRQVVKDLVNAVYGFLGYHKSRLFDIKIAEKITKTARGGLKFIRDILSEKYEIIYGDTDSMFIKLNSNLSFEEVLEKGREIEEYINQRLPEYSKSVGSEKNYFSVSFEKVYDPILFISGTKKRYAGRIRFMKGKETDYVDITGFDSIRSDTPLFLKDVQENLFNMILYNNDKKEIIEYIKSIYKNIKENKYSYNDLGIPKGIQKDINEYKYPIPFHIKAVLYSNRYLNTNFGKGDKVKILFIKHIKGYPKTDVIAFDDETKIPEVEIDKSKYITWYRQKVERILENIGLNFKNIISENKTLLDW